MLLQILSRVLTAQAFMNFAVASDVATTATTAVIVITTCPWGSQGLFLSSASGINLRQFRHVRVCSNLYQTSITGPSW
jgi:hypothetical protein